VICDRHNNMDEKKKGKKCPCDSQRVIGTQQFLDCSSPPTPSKGGLYSTVAGSFQSLFFIFIFYFFFKNRREDK
jgi:hypothetical protein